MPIRTSALAMFIHCKMAPGTHATENQSAGSVVLRPRHRLENLSWEMNPASSEESYDGHVAVQQTCVPACRPRHQDRHHHRRLDDHLHPVPHVAQADGDCWGKGINSTCVATWLPTRQSRAQGISRVYLPSEDYAICQSISALA